MRKRSGKKTKKELPDPHQQPAPENDERPAAGSAAFVHDITGPEQALEALRESESVLQSFFDSSGVMRGIVEVIAEDDVQHIADNAMSAGFLGLTPEAMKNKRGSELGEPLDILRMWIGHYLESRKSKKPVTFEYLDKRGEPGARLLATVSYLGTPPGGYPRFAYVVLDITERKRAEEALREEQDKTSAILKGIADTFYSLDEDWRITLVNPASEKAPFGRPAGELLGRVIWDLYPNLVGTRIHRHYLDAAEKFTLEHYEAQSPLNGRWYEVFMQGRKGGVDVYMRDITERKQVEEELRKSRDDLEMRVEERTAELKEALEALGTERRRLYDVLETLPVYVCLLDKDYRMPFVNRYFRETFREPEGRRCYDFLFNRSEPCETCETYTVKKTRAPHHWFWTGPNGRDYDVYDFPFTDSDGSFMILEMGIDITERKAAEEKWTALASIVEQSEDAIIGKSLAGVITSWNAGAEKMYGYSAEEAIGRDISILIPPGENDDLKYILNRIRMGEPVIHYDTVRKRKDGVSIQVSLTISPTKDGKGTLIGASTIARDITERKKAEEELRKAHDLLDARVKERTAELVQSNTRLRTEIEERRRAESTLRETSQYLENLINHANAPIIVWDPAFRITLFNRAFEHLTDWTAADVIGKPLDILLPQGCLAQVMDLIRKTIEGERWESVEIPIRHKRGSIRTVLWNSASIFGADGKTIVSIIAQGQDITDRKKIESEYRLRASEYAKMNVELEEEIRQREISDGTLKKTLSLLNATLESTADGIFVVDQQGTITSYNQNFVNMWNIPTEVLESGNSNEIIKYLMPQLKDPESMVTSLKELETHPGRESFDMIEFNDGKIFERYSKPQRIGDTVVGRVWSFRDITDRKHAEENLVASLNEKEVLLREIHHRVKNNLQLISGLLDMTRMRAGNESTNEILTDMMLKIQTMAQIHTRLYESKQFGKVSLTSQIRDQIAGLSNIYSHKGHEISCVIHSDEVSLPVDQAIPCALVVNEILSNAYKHAFKGRETGTIEISAGQKNGRISITIRDDGIGLPADLDISRTSSLGLKLIRTLVSHQLKGSLTLKSQNGTEMNIEFPLIPQGT